MPRSRTRDKELGENAIRELMKAVDDYIPTPARPIDKPFLMPIEDVFSISGRGTVVTGRVERGIVKVGEELEIVGIRPTTKTTCTGVEMFRKLLDQGQAGDNIGALLRGVDRDGVERGQVLAKPGTVKPHKKFVAEAYILTKEEGGRHTPFFTNYRPQFYFRTTDVTGIVSLPEGTEMVMPGDNVTVDVELIVPIAMEEKLRFAIREGGRTVGAGIVASIVRVRPTDLIRAARNSAAPRRNKEETHERTEYPHPPRRRSTTACSMPRRARSCRRPSAREPTFAAPFRCRRGSRSSRSTARRTSTRRAASSSRCARTSGCSTSSIRRRRRSTR